MSWFAVGSLVVTAIGTGVAIHGQQQAAKAAEDAAEYNNKLAEIEARNREAEAAEQIRRERIAKRERIGALRARLAQSGSLLTSGAPLAILGESSARMEIALKDAARATSMESASIRAAGKMGLWEADQARTAANYQSAATALQGASSTVSSAYDFNKKGAFTTRTKNTQR